jgi:hypothetical protein
MTNTQPEVLCYDQNVQARERNGMATTEGPRHRQAGSGAVRLPLKAGGLYFGAMFVLGWVTGLIRELLIRDRARGKVWRESDLQDLNRNCWFVVAAREGTKRHEIISAKALPAAYWDRGRTAPGMPSARQQYQQTTFRPAPPSSLGLQPQWSEALGCGVAL